MTAATHWGPATRPTWEMDISTRLPPTRITVISTAITEMQDILAGLASTALFQFVGVEPLNMAPQSLPAPSVAIIGIALPDYESHIPDGLDRPNWLFAA